ncbi:hypothetical protein EBBID32_42710 [Sphingobium indicum BiD32]|uniref:Uncharacterized protein n=1 Tax=Sphingobium indicum BiD32 TaxID=1301087 RepID=N1MRQ6_9SPHN|nr:hypothetical protein EBBID32_42710 [Sphingobium indicum BiD32]
MKYSACLALIRTLRLNEKILRWPASGRRVIRAYDERG